MAVLVVSRGVGALAVAGLVALSGVAPAQAATATTAAVTGPVVLVGVGGLRWDDVTDDTPNLQDVQAVAGVAQLADRSVRDTTCPADGWLAVSAGRRAADVERPVCRDLTLDVARAGATATVPNWADYTAQAGRDTFDATPGLLGKTLAAAGRKTAAVGPGAAIALAEPQADGTATVAHAWSGTTDGPSGTADPSGLYDDVAAAVATDPDLLVIDAGAIRDPGEWPDGSKPTGAYTQDRATQVQNLDNRLELVLDALPDDATVVLASLSDSGTTAQLRLLAAEGPAVGGGRYDASLLRTASTRQNGLVQATDLTPTLLDALGVAVPADAVGSSLRAVDHATGGSAAADRRQKMLDLDQAARRVTPIVPWFFVAVVGAQLLVYGIGALLARGAGDDVNPVARRRRAPALRTVRIVAVLTATVPAATFLANLLPWWRVHPVGLAVAVAVGVFALPLGLVALLGTWRRHLLGPFGAIGAITALVLFGDVATGSHLMLSSLMGVQPVIAGRFYGFSNPAFGLFATGSLMAAIAAADVALRAGRRRRAVGWVAGIGLFALVADGAPMWGADFGGPPAIVPAFAVLAVVVSGRKVSWKLAGAILTGTVGVLVALGLADWLRPPESRTHLGRFVQTLIDGGAWSVVSRKASQNLTILTSSPLALAIPVVAAVVVYALARPAKVRLNALATAYERAPALRPGLAAVGLLFLLGFALNDSGVTIPVVSALILLPGLVAATARALEEQDQERLESALAKVKRGARR